MICATVKLERLRSVFAPLGAFIARIRRPCFHLWDRLFRILFSRWWPQWRDSLIIVQPEMVLRWRREGLSALWRIEHRAFDVDFDVLIVSLDPVFLTFIRSITLLRLPGPFSVEGRAKATADAGFLFVTVRARPVIL
jgi:hypothetical protein